MRRNGFTLLEMLIALSIFGMLTAAGIVLLGLSVRTQEASERLLDRAGAIRRTGSLMTLDLAQAVPRPWRDREGRPHPAFSGRSGDEPMLMVFVRNAREGAGIGPSRVAYRFREGRLERLAYPRVDGAGPTASVLLLDGVSAARLRYRDREGEWRERWDPTDSLRLPVAIELVTTGADHGELRQLFLVGAPR